MKKKSTKATPVAQAAGLLLLCTLVMLFACLATLGVSFRHNASLTLQWPQLFPLAAFILGCTLTLIWLRLIGWQGDAGLLGALFLLCGIGLTIQFRMGSFAGGWERPLALLLFPSGLLAFMAGATLTSGGKGKHLAGMGWLAYLATIGLMSVMLMLGERFRGGIYMPGYTNPSEIVKLLLIAFLAAFLSQRQKDFTETQVGIPVPALDSLLLLVFLWCLPMLLTIGLKDLGLMVLLNATLVIMLFAVARATGYLALGVSAITAIAFGMRALSETARTRFDVWLNPFADPAGRGWQTLQALCAMYSGGMWGSGLGAGLPKTVPIVTSDFIYAALAEETGLAGCALILLVYAVLYARGFRTASIAKTPFERLLGVGLTGSLAVQTLVNVAGVTKALPMTGVTLPFISHGGSSLLTSMLMAGLLVGLSDQQ